MRDGCSPPDDRISGSTRTDDLEDRVRDAFGEGAVILAVSGGRDSMALLHAAARAAPERVRAVATFDHGTGAYAIAAAALVAARAAEYGLPCRGAQAAAGIRHTEADWRNARWQFLRRVASDHSAVVVTAHNRDDQLETVAIRILRQAGARGLAGLDADGAVIRPWLDVARVDVARYAARHGVPYLEDPSNASRSHLRNRVRLDLLPALRRVRPGIDADILTVAAAAARWRRAAEHLVGQHHPVRREPEGALVAAAGLSRYDAESLAVVWPVIAARAGITLDRRGTARLVAFTTRGKVGGVIQLSGGIDVQRSPSSFVLRRREVGDRALARAPRSMPAAGGSHGAGERKGSSDS